MKINKVLPLIALLGGLILTGCNTNKSADPSKDQSSSGEPASSSVLTFLQDNQIRFDIMDELGGSFKYGEDVVTSKQAVALSNAELTFNGTLSASTVNFIVVGEAKEDAFSCAVNPGIEKDSFAEYLASFATDYLIPNLGGKVYVAISDGSGSKDPTWTKGLNTEMDEKIQSHIDVIKNLSA